VLINSAPNREYRDSPHGVLRMVFELFGFVSGVGAIGAAWILLLRHERFKVINGFYAGSRAGGGRGNALIWPSR